MENQKSKAYISLEEKSEECIAKKHSLYEYYKHLIVPKTYGTFRIYANSIEKLILNYNKSGHITDKEASELREYIAQKRLVKERVIECDVNLEKYLDDIESLIDTIEISNKKRNTIFSIFFSLINNIKTLINLKSEEVTIKETKHGIIVTVNVDGDVVNIVSRKYTKMFI